MATNIDLLIAQSVKLSEGARGKSRCWTAAEDAYLRENLGLKTEAQMGKALGRTRVAVLLRWKRDLKLESPSMAKDILTANRMAKILGIDGHKTAHWADKGLFPSRLMAGARKIRLIKREDFETWVLNHDNWIYFDMNAVTDEELKRKLLEAAKAWDDEWWTTPQVAKYHKVGTGDVKRYIRAGRIKAKQIQVSYGGRHPHLRWRLWFVLKSEAVQIHFVRRKK